MSHGEKRSVGQRMRDCRGVFWNSETGEFLGRNGKSWCLILLFYLVYYGALAGFFAVCLVVFFTTLDDRAPTQTYMYSLLKQNPGMGFRPKTSDGTSIIFRANDSNTYKEYIGDLQTFLNSYSVNSSVAHDCDGILAASKLPSDVFCFPLSNLGDNCTAEKQYGYPEGKPCVLLKMNKIYGWIPKPYDNETKHLAKLPEDRLDSKYVGVTCEGEVDADKDSILGVTFHPAKGFPSVYYPYLNQPGYLPPVVMAQFDVVPGRLVMVWCRVWAQNIKHDRIDLQGSVHFEIMVD